jgi:GAF domain-containing protein
MSTGGFLMQTANTIDIEVFKTITRAISHSHDPEVMADHLTQLLVAATGIKGCTIFALNPQSDELEVMSSFGLSAEYLNKGPVLSEKSIQGVRRGEPIVVHDISESDLLQYPENARAEGIRAVVSVPILLYGRVIGALRLYHAEPWDISDTDLDFLLVLGEHVGLALTYVRLVTALNAVRDVVGEIHGVWLSPDRR